MPTPKSTRRMPAALRRYWESRKASSRTPTGAPPMPKKPAKSKSPSGRPAGRGMLSRAGRGIASPQTLGAVAGTAAGLLLPGLIVQALPIAAVRTAGPANILARVAVGVAGAAMVRRFSPAAALGLLAGAIAQPLATMLASRLTSGATPRPAGVSGLGYDELMGYLPVTEGVAGYLPTAEGVAGYLPEPGLADDGLTDDADDDLGDDQEPIGLGTLTVADHA